MLNKSDVLTTGQVAQICNVAPRTVTKWFDSGQLKGYRIPGSRDRRIPASELFRFMKAHDIPTDGFDIGILRVLIIDASWQDAEDLSNGLKSRKNYDVHTAQNSFDAGLVAHKLIPHAVLIDITSKEIDAEQISKFIRSNQDLSGTRVIAIADNPDNGQIEQLMEKGFDSVIKDRNDYADAVKVIEQVTAIIY